MFYTSRMLLDAETRYSNMEKLVLALVNVKKKLHHYFETHVISVIIDFPIVDTEKTKSLWMTDEMGNQFGSL